MLVFIVKAPNFQVPQNIHLIHSHLPLGDHSRWKEGSGPNYKHGQLDLEVPKGPHVTTKILFVSLNVLDARRHAHTKWLILQMNH